MGSGWQILAEGSMQAAVLLVMALGLIFTFIPILPGTLIIWGAALAYGLALGWPSLGWPAFSVITVLMLVGMVADALAGHYGARRGGASWPAIIVGAVVGFVLGTVFSLIATPITGCFAGLLGAVGGVWYVEWQRRQDWDLAGKATRGYIMGAALGIIAKIISGVLMVAVFVARIYWGP